MLSVAVLEPGNVELVQIPKPVPGPYEARVRTEVVCLCNATDRKLVEGFLVGELQPSKLEQLLLPAGKRLCVFIAQMLHGQKRQHLEGPLPKITLTDGRVHRKGRHVKILQNGQAPEGAGHLKSTPKTRLRHLVRRQRIDTPAIQINRAAGGFDHPVKDIGQRGLTGTIGSD